MNVQMSIFTRDAKTCGFVILKSNNRDSEKDEPPLLTLNISYVVELIYIRITEKGVHLPMILASVITYKKSRNNRLF